MNKQTTNISRVSEANDNYTNSGLNSHRISNNATHQSNNIQTPTQNTVNNNGGSNSNIFQKNSSP